MVAKLLRNLFVEGESESKTLRIIITRHGERVDFTYGDNWFRKMQRAGLQNPNISPLPPRMNPNHWNNDTPITIRGEAQASSVGRKLLRLGCPIDFCYTSPAYRSIQTATKILEGQGRAYIPISIEPGLFECPSWYEGHPLNFISPRELAQSKRFNVNRSYSPYYDTVDPREKERGFYKRSRDLIQSIIESHATTGGTVLLSGHGGSIEALTRGLRDTFHRRGGATRLIEASEKVDYCNFAILQRDGYSGEWTVAIPGRSNQLQVVALNKRSSIPLFDIEQHGYTEHHHPRYGNHHQQQGAAHGHHYPPHRRNANRQNEIHQHHAVGHGENNRRQRHHGNQHDPRRSPRR